MLSPPTCTGGSMADVVRTTVQPGTGWARSEASGASVGTWMRRATVLAASLSFGTRKVTFP
jgi:hypothetical protein